MTQLLTAREFRESFWKVLRALAQGETFLLIEDGLPLARLLPLPRDVTLQAPGRVPDVRPHSQRAAAVLGEASLGRVLGLTRPTFTQQNAAGAFAPPVCDRLAALSNALAEQATWMTEARMRAWWHRAHQDLRGRSPVDHLALPWVSGDARSARVFDLIHRQRLLQDIARQDARA